MKKLMESVLIFMLLIVFTASFALPQEDYNKVKIAYSDGLSAFKEGNYTKAQKHFKKLTELSPDYAYGYFMLGLCNMKQDDYDSAVEYLKQAEKKGKKDTDLYVNLGNAYYYKGDKDSGLRAINKVDVSKISSDKNRYNFHFYRGRMYLEKKKYDKAISDLEKAISLKSSSTTAHSMLGQAYYATGNYDQAVDKFKKVLQSDSSNRESLSYISRAYINLAKREGSASQKENYYNSAIRYARKLVDTAGGRFESHNILGRSLLGAGKYQRSIPSFKKALKYKSDHCHARFNLGQSYYAVQDYNSALSTLKKASRCMSGKSGEDLVWFYLGKTYDNLGKLQQSKNAFQKASNMGNSNASKEIERIAAKIQNKEVEQEKQKLENEKKEARKHRRQVKRNITFSELSMEKMDVGEDKYVYIFGTVTNESSESLATLVIGIDFLKNENKIFSSTYTVNPLEKDESKSIEYDMPLSEMDGNPDDYKIYAHRIVLAASE